MFTLSLPAWLTRLRVTPPSTAPILFPRPHLSVWSQPGEALPIWVRESAVALRYWHLLGPLDWTHCPDRLDQRFDPDCPPLSYASVAAAYLIKIDQHLPHSADLRRYLVEQPALVWLLGFPLRPSAAYTWGFDADASLPAHRHFSRLLRTLPETTLQYLLDNTVQRLLQALQPEMEQVGDCVSLDTKHLIAWVKENNPKAYVHGKRFDKTQPPKGDPDCRLGCKRKTNQVAATSQPTSSASPPTPTTNPLPAKTLAVGEYYWGYGSGIVATKVPNYGEFVLAELTQPFDQPDVSYFQPLLTATTQRLGHQPPFGALDAAYDAFYVYEYFHNAGGFAAVPFVERGAHPRSRQFAADGSPLCSAGLAMPLKYRFMDKTACYPHECGRYVCPLVYPQASPQACPVQHARWAKGGCVTTLPLSIGARLRYTLDRHSEQYQAVYQQRTATERIHSQAVEFGIERPKLRNGQSIAHYNTLIYILINLHALQRIRQRLAERSA